MMTSITLRMTCQWPTVADSDDDAVWLLGDPVTSKLNAFFTAAIRELPDDATGFDAAFPCVTSVPSGPFPGRF